MEAEINKDAPELSIVIPAYNASKYILRTLCTLENQTADREKYRIIIVDDGSIDDTLFLCTQFAKSYTNIQIIHQENGGVSSARNAGIEAAEGRWITFVDSDDYVDKQYVEKIISICPEEPYVVFDNLLEYGNKLVEEKIWMKPFCNKTHDIMNVLLWICDNKLNAPWDKRFSLEVIKSNQVRFRSGINMGEDLLFVFEYALCVKSAYLCDQPLYIHTDNLDGLCHKAISETRLYEMEIIYNEMQSACTKQCLDEKYCNIINLAFLRMITSCVGQLYTSGIPGKRITQYLKENKMVRKIMEGPSCSYKNAVRKLLIQARLYNVCAWLSK